MNNPLFIFMCAFSLSVLACGKKKDESRCRPNGNYDSHIKAQVKVTFKSPGRFLIPIDAKRRYDENYIKVSDRKSGRYLIIDDEENRPDENTMTEIDFNNMQLSNKDYSFSFFPEEILSKGKKQRQYRINSQEMIKWTKIQTPFPYRLNNDITLCSIDSMEVTFKYKKGDNRVTSEATTKFSAQFSQRALDDINSEGSL